MKSRVVESLLQGRKPGVTGLLPLCCCSHRLTDWTALRPDASVIPVPVDRQCWNELPTGAPVLAVEVISTDEADRLEQKIATYLLLGMREVWVAYPTYKRIYVHRQTQVERLNIGDTLTSEVLPGFSAPVSTFFEGLP